jgi:formamidopyrimidine-DNA glycosylase
MPELPEIENLTAALRPRLVGQTIVDVRTRQPKMLNLSLEEFATRARGPIVDVRRRGKSAVLRLHEGSIWLHLGLGGLVTLGEPPAKEPQLAILLGDGSQLAVDRTFMGHAHYYAESDHHARWDGFGPDPSDDAFTEARLRAVLATKPKQALKALFMDQARLAGIGNVYSDEILHAARLHPGRQAGSLTEEEVTRLHDAFHRVLAEAIASGGEPDYQGLDGARGHYAMRVHGLEACLDCGGPVSQTTIGGRTGYYCPKCQT